MFDHKKYYIENREKFKKYREDNRENQKEYIKKYKENNPEKMKINEKKYNKTEKGKMNKQKKDSKRRSLFKFIVNTLTVKEWKDILISSLQFSGQIRLPCFHDLPGRGIPAHRLSTRYVDVRFVKASHRNKNCLFGIQSPVGPSQCHPSKCR